MPSEPRRAARTRACQASGTVRKWTIRKPWLIPATLVPAPVRRGPGGPLARSFARARQDSVYPARYPADLRS